MVEKSVATDNVVQLVGVALKARLVEGAEVGGVLRIGFVPTFAKRGRMWATRAIWATQS